MFMNKNQYRQYIAKTNPKKHAEKEWFNQELHKYSELILTLTERMVENPEDSPTTEIHEIFETYVQVLLRHFQLKEIESANLYHYQDEEKEEEEVLFGKIDTEPVFPKRSFWGKYKVIQR
jgi:hypothetical protein